MKRKAMNDFIMESDVFIQMHVLKCCNAFKNDFSFISIYGYVVS